MAVIMGNDSFTPTRLDPDVIFTPSNHHDDRSVIGAFRRAVQMTLDDTQERTALFDALKRFHASRVVEDLMDDLKDILDSPDKRILYKYISPLIPYRLRAEYKSLVPHIPSFDRKIIRLKLQGGSHSFGFTVRGGKEFGCGIFVSNVLKSSKAAQAGLQLGDKIDRLNGLILSECTHEEFVNLVKKKRSLVLTVKSVGLIPEKIPGIKKVTWKSVGEKKGWQPTTRIGVHGPIQSTRRIQVTLEGNESLGASVKTSSAVDGGVLILNILPNSPADNAGLQRGDEILQVNGTSLIGRTLDEATRILRSSNMLMLTIRVEENSHGGGIARNSLDASDFEAGPHDFDIDADTLSPRGGHPSGSRNWHSEDSGFVLRMRSPPGQRKNHANPLKKMPSGRIEVTNSDVEQSRLLPTMASPAAFGYGPAVTMPTIMGLGQTLPNVPFDESTDFAELTPGYEPMTSPKRVTVSPRSSVSPPIAPIGRATVEGQGSPPVVQDLSMFQFPAADEGSGGGSGHPKPRRQVSALKKNLSTEGQRMVKHPMFDDNIQIIPRQGGPPIPSSASRDTLNSSSLGFHPSNLSFSQEILQGRQVKFHTIPKDGPLRLAIRGGRDTPLGPKIIVSRIIEEGSAHRYGKLNVGDQILVCDGVSLIDVTHDEAAEAFKRAMNLNSRSIDLVVAVNPDVANITTTRENDTDI